MKVMAKGIIFDIAHGSYVDGPGLRTTVFFKGCNLRCSWCHNPESQDQAPAFMFYKNKCTGCVICKEICTKSRDECDLCKECTLYCPTGARKICGKEYTADEVIAELIKDRDYYEDSDGGVTFSGGECMLQIDFLLDLLKKCKEQGIHTAIDTAGCVPFENFERILPYADLFLYDIKTTDPIKHLEYTGVKNELILNNLKKLLKIKAKIWIRIPVIASINDSEEEMQAIKKFFDENGWPQKVELLPYHSLGEDKYVACGKKRPEFSTPTEARINRLKNIFDRH